MMQETNKCYLQLIQFDLSADKQVSIQSGKKGIFRESWQLIDMQQEATGCTPSSKSLDDIYLYHTLKYRQSIPAPVDRTSSSAWLYKHPWITCQNNYPSTSMTHVACESKLRSILRSSMPRKLDGNQVCGLYYARAVHALSAGNKC